MNNRKLVNCIGILAITLWECTPAFSQGDPPPTPPPTPSPTPTPVTEVQQQPNLFQTLQQQQQIQSTINTQLNNFLQTNPTISPLDQRAGLVDKTIKMNMPFSNMSIKIQVPVIKNSHLLAPSNTQVTNVQTEKPGSTSNTPVQTVQIQNATPTPKTVEVKTVQVQQIATPINSVQVTDVKTEIKTTTSTTQVTNVQTEKPSSTNNTQSTTVQVLDPTSYSNTKISVSDGPTSILKQQDVPTNLTKLPGFTKLSDFERTPFEGRYSAILVKLIDNRLEIEAWKLMNVSPELAAEKAKLATMTDLTDQEREKLKTLAKKGDKAPPVPDSILGKVVNAIEEKISGDPQAKIDREIAERARLEEIQNAYATQLQIVTNLENAQKIDNESIKKLETEIGALEKAAQGLQGSATKPGNKPALDTLVQRISMYLKQMDLMAAQLRLLKIIRAGDKSTDTREAKAEAHFKNQLLHAVGYIKMVSGLMEGASPSAVEQRNYVESRLKESNDYDYFLKALNTPKTVEEFKKAFF